MLGLEFRRSINGKYLIYIMLVSFLTFILGYALPVGIDKVNSISYGEYLFSTYTVITQFGFLIFGFVIALFFNSDYSSKNILFYKSFNINSLKLFFNKSLVLWVESIFIMVVLNFLVSILYNNFSYFLFSTCYFCLVIAQYIMIIGILSMCFSNILVAYGVSLIYWISSIMLSAIAKSFSFLALYDASNPLFEAVEKYLKTGNFNIALLIPIPYTIILFTITLLISKLVNKRWTTLGID
ncbi:peptide ABC transporter permease [Enterococcus sp. LJL99]